MKCRLKGIPVFPATDHKKCDGFQVSQKRSVARLLLFLPIVPAEALQLPDLKLPDSRGQVWARSKWFVPGILRQMRQTS